MLSRELEKEIVLTAVSQNGRALKYASDALEKDEDVIMASIKENGLVLSFVGKTFQSNLGTNMRPVFCYLSNHYGSDARHVYSSLHTRLCRGM